MFDLLPFDDIDAFVVAVVVAASTAGIVDERRGETNANNLEVVKVEVEAAEGAGCIEEVEGGVDSVAVFLDGVSIAVTIEDVVESLLELLASSSTFDVSVLLVSSASWFLMWRSTRAKSSETESAGRTGGGHDDRRLCRWSLGTLSNIPLGGC